MNKNYPNRIYLIGLPSSGKSTFGTLLAQAMNYHFLDTDTWIVAQNNRSIPEIFEEYGELHFRKLEQQALENTQHLDQTIIATGGGLPCFFDAIFRIKQLGLAIFLNISPQTIAQRISQDDTSRPLLKTQNLENILPQIQQKYQERISYYRQAHLILEEHEITPKIVLERLVKLHHLDSNQNSNKSIKI